MRLASRLFVAMLLMAIVFVVLSACARAGQSHRKLPSGTISDSSGGVLPGVTVIAKNAQTGLTQQTTSGGEGDWRIPALPIGTYEVAFELDGFKRLLRSGVIVEAAVIRSVPATLEVGGMTETVNVTGDASLLSAATSRPVVPSLPRSSRPFRPRRAASRTCCHRKRESALTYRRC